MKTLGTPAVCTFTPKDGGFYVAKAVVHDASGRAQSTAAGLHVLGSGWVSWQRNDTDRIDLVPDKTLYDVGETARILVKSPFPDCEALLTVEREGVFTARRVRLAGAATALDVPLGEGDIPNVFVSVVLVRGRVQAPAGTDLRDDAGRPTVRVGYTQLKVERKSKRLLVELSPDAEEKRPRDKVSVSVHVTDWKAQGTQAEVTVWAVDEGVLRLTSYQVPDPMEAVHPLRGLSVRLGEPLIHLVQRKLYGEKGLGGLTARARKAVEGSEYLEDLILLREVDDAGRVPGAVVGTVEEALVKIQQHARMSDQSTADVAEAVLDGRIRFGADEH